MIEAVLIFNTAGKPRLSKFYSPSSPSNRAQTVTRIFDLVSSRPDTVCNFVELAHGFRFGPEGTTIDGEGDGDAGEDLRVIYRHYATLYFVFVVDQSESELGILDLIQVFVESLDRCFENVCELDLIFHFDDVHALLACIITGGLVLDTSIDSIAQSFAAQKKAKVNSTNSGLLTANLGGISLGGLQKGLVETRAGLGDRLGIGNGFSSILGRRS